MSAHFSPALFDFLVQLKKHNRREWFQPRKAVFEETLKQPMRELVSAVNDAMKSFAPEYVTDPDKAIYRIYRDTRFSKDKTPYKSHLAASFPRHATPCGAGFYVAISHKTAEIGGGIYMPSRAELLAIRTAIAQRHEELRRIVGARHQPPPVHQTFEGHGFVVCSFVPRPFDFGEGAVKVPYHHAHVDSDVVLFSSDGDFMSRAGSGIGVGSMSFHPAGIVHGPQPGSLEVRRDPAVPVVQVPQQVAHRVRSRVLSRLPASPARP